MRIALEVPGARSLKDKRQVTRSFTERVRARMGVSIAEIAHQDKYQRATFGVAVVSGDAAVCEELLGKVISIANSLPNALLIDRAFEIIPFGEGASGVRGGIEQFGAELFSEGDEIDDEIYDDEEEGP